MLWICRRSCYRSTYELRSVPAVQHASPLPPKAKLETTAALKACIAARAALAELKALAPKVYSRELTELIFAQPYCRIGNVVDAEIAQRQSASVYLKALAGIGVLEERKAGRERLFINPALIDLLTTDAD